MVHKWKYSINDGIHVGHRKGLRRDSKKGENEGEL